MTLYQEINYTTEISVQKYTFDQKIKKNRCPTVRTLDILYENNITRELYGHCQ